MWSNGFNDWFSWLIARCPKEWSSTEVPFLFGTLFPKTTPFYRAHLIDIWFIHIVNGFFGEYFPIELFRAFTETHHRQLRIFLIIVFFVGVFWCILLLVVYFSLTYLVDNLLFLILIRGKLSSQCWCLFRIWSW